MSYRVHFEKILNYSTENNTAVASAGCKTTEACYVNEQLRLTINCTHCQLILFSLLPSERSTMNADDYTFFTITDSAL